MKFLIPYTINTKTTQGTESKVKVIIRHLVKPQVEAREQVMEDSLVLRQSVPILPKKQYFSIYIKPHTGWIARATLAKY